MVRARSSLDTQKIVYDCCVERKGNNNVMFWKAVIEFQNLYGVSLKQFRFRFAILTIYNPSSATRRQCNGLKNHSRHKRICLCLTVTKIGNIGKEFCLFVVFFLVL